MVRKPRKEAQSAPEDGSKPPSFLRRVFGEMNKRLVTTLAVLLLAVPTAMITGFASFIGSFARDTFDGFARPYIDAHIARELEDPDTDLSTLLTRRIDQRLSQNVGSAVAGSFLLDASNPSNTIGFYLPEGHHVDVDVKVDGLAVGDMVRITTPFPELNQEITTNKSIPIRIRRGARDRENQLLGTGLAVEFLPAHGPMRHLTLIAFTLSPAQQAAEDDEAPGSSVSVSFVGLLSPPIRRDSL